MIPKANGGGAGGFVHVRGRDQWLNVQQPFVEVRGHRKPGRLYGGSFLKLGNKPCALNLGLPFSAGEGVPAAFRTIYLRTSDAACLGKISRDAQL